MSGIYSVEDLLKLRASPLICKPPNLPPIEEWMGSQEPVNKRPTTRGRQDENHLPTEGFQKRPTLDPSRKSTTDPERIVLGPPRRSFASSNARNLGKAGVTDHDDTQKEGTGRHERAKTSEDLDNKFGDRRGTQSSGANGRFGNRHDSELDRPRRRYDEEDGETRPKKDHDRAKWNKEEKGPDDLDENGALRSGIRRDHQTRSRFEQSWLRSDRGTEEARRDNERSGWRNKTRDGDWDTPGKGDVDPEWMDEPEAAEPVQAHTQEDFQRWKERMKAAANGPAEEKLDPPTTIVASVDNRIKPGQGMSSTGLISPDNNVDSMDKFFAKFTEKRAPPEEKGPTAKPATKSKFASLFSPSLEVKPEPVPVPVMPASPVVIPMPSIKPTASTSATEQGGVNTEADQAGFKRILEMLGKREVTPGAEAPKSKQNISNSEQQPQETYGSPDLVSLFKASQPSRQTGVSQVPPGFERPSESRSPIDGHRRQQTPNKDELLLNLLRQAEISAKPTQQSSREYGEQRPPPGLFASMTESSRNEARHIHDERSDIDRQGPVPQRSNGRSMFDDPAISGISYQDELGARQGLQRRPTGGYEDQYFDRLRQQEQQKPIQPPPGMGRPPGLDQLSRPPPGWPSQLPPPHPPQPRQGPPPGISMPRGIQPPFGGPQQPLMPPVPQQNQRPPQRKYTGDSALPSYPPGIGPPPGFMQNGPLPGFHNSGAGNQGQNYGRYGMPNDGQGPPPQGPPNMSRAFMEMYGGADRGGLRGGNGGVPLPPGFR